MEIVIVLVIVALVAHWLWAFVSGLFIKDKYRIIKETKGDNAVIYLAQLRGPFYWGGLWHESRTVSANLEGAQQKIAEHKAFKVRRKVIRSEVIKPDAIPQVLSVGGPYESDMAFKDFDEYAMSCFIDHATGGKLSKPGWALETLKAAHDEHVSELVDEAVKEDRESFADWLFGAYATMVIDQDVMKRALEEYTDAVEDPASRSDDRG